MKTVDPKIRPNTIRDAGGGPHKATDTPLATPTRLCRRHFGWAVTLIAALIAPAHGSDGPGSQQDATAFLAASGARLLDPAPPGTAGLSDAGPNLEFRIVEDQWATDLVDPQPRLPRAGLTSLLEALAEPVGDEPRLNPPAKPKASGERNRVSQRATSTEAAASARQILAAADLLPTPKAAPGSNDDIVLTLGREPLHLNPSLPFRDTSPTELITSDVAAIDTGKLPDPLDDAVRCTIEMHSASLLNAKGFFRLTVEVPADAARLAPLPQEVVFVVLIPEADRERWLEPLKQALGNVLRKAPSGDRFNIAKHGTNLTLFSVDAIPINDRSINKSMRFLAGQTVNPRAPVTSIGELIANAPSSGRPRSIILIGPTVELTAQRAASVFRVRSPNPGSTPPTVHHLGLGERPDGKCLLKFIADQHQGQSIYAPSPKDVAVVLGGVMEMVDRPVLVDTRVVVEGASISEVYPSTIGHLYDNRPVTLYGRFHQPGHLFVWIAGRNRARPTDAVCRLDTHTAKRGGSQIEQEWAVRKMRHMLQESAASDATDADRKALNDHCDRYGLPKPD